MNHFTTIMMIKGDLREIKLIAVEKALHKKLYAEELIRSGHKHYGAHVLALAKVELANARLIPGGKYEKEKEVCF